MSQWRRQRKQFLGFSWWNNKVKWSLVFMDLESYLNKIKALSLSKAE
jgi:hypothetical protein